jgi:hypothetical protein
MMRAVVDNLDFLLLESTVVDSGTAQRHGMVDDVFKNWEFRVGHRTLSKLKILQAGSRI